VISQRTEGQDAEQEVSPLFSRQRGAVVEPVADLATPFSVTSSSGWVMSIA
jgi:hypothetical protein